MATAPRDHPHLHILTPRLPEVLGELPRLASLPPDYMSPPSLGRVPPTPASLRQGLGVVGNAPVPADLWTAFGLPLTLPLHPPVQPRASTDADIMLHTLADAGLLFPLQDQPAAPAFVTAKTPDKARLLLDMRLWNKQWPKPPRFPLPKLSQILDCPQAPLLFFTKLDVSNFFWSLRLPHFVHGSFALSAGSRVFGSRRLPFGWSWSPILAQLTLARILSPLSSRFSHILSVLR